MESGDWCAVTTSDVQKVEMLLPVVTSLLCHYWTKSLCNSSHLKKKTSGLSISHEFTKVSVLSSASHFF